MTKRMQVMKRRLHLYMMVLTNKLRRRPEYIFYTFFGLLVLVSGMLAFWPEKAENFNIFVPEQKAQPKLPGQKLTFKLVKVYGAGTVLKPVSVFVDEKNIYAADIQKNKVIIFTKDSKTRAVISGTGKKQKEPLNYPNAVAPLGEDKLLLSESGGKRLIIYNRDSAFVRVLNVSGGRVLKPGYVLVQDDKFYISDLEGHDIKVIDKTGKYITAFGSPMNNVYLMKFPQGLAFDSKGNLWVADGGNARVISFNAQGNYLRSFKGTEAGGNPFNMVKGLAVLAGRYLCVSDPIANNIRIFDLASNLKEVGTISQIDSKAGKLLYPMGLYADDDSNHLFVADRGNSRILEFTFE